MLRDGQEQEIQLRHMLNEIAICNVQQIPSQAAGEQGRGERSGQAGEKNGRSKQP